MAEWSFEPHRNLLGPCSICACGYPLPQRRDAELKTGGMYDLNLQKQLCVMLVRQQNTSSHSTSQTKSTMSPSLSEGTWRDPSSSVHKETPDRSGVEMSAGICQVFGFGVWGKDVLCKIIGLLGNNQKYIWTARVKLWRGLKAGKSFSWNISHVHLQSKTVLLTEAE